MQGSDTQWYKNVLNNPMIRVGLRGAEAKFQALPITDAKRVSSAVEKLRDKYGNNDVKKYYSKFDVAVFAQMPSEPGYVPRYRGDCVVPWTSPCISGCGPCSY